MLSRVSLYRVSDEITSFFLEIEALHSYLCRFCEDAPHLPESDRPREFSDVLSNIQWGLNLSRDARQTVYDDAMWLFRRAHSRIFPGTLLRNRYASYHDLALWESENFLTSLQLSNHSEDERRGETVIQDDWPTAINLVGIAAVLSTHKGTFDDLEPLQGYLKLEAAAAANICPSAAMESQAQPGGVTPDDLTPREHNTIEALSNKSMQAYELAKVAGYQNNSNFRTMLSNLVKRGYLINSRADGYSCTNKCHDTSR